MQNVSVKGNYLRDVVDDAKGIIDRVESSARFEREGIPKRRSLLDSFRYAFCGLKFAFSTQRNIVIHSCAALLAISLAFILGVKPIEMAVILLCSMFVIVCEIINTALELSLDLVNGNKYHPLVKVIKDVVASGVLISAICSIAIGSIIFLKYIL